MHQIIYHMDPDGYASGGIVATALQRQGVKEEEIGFHPINYGMDLPELDYENDKVYMVDFSLQPDEEMIKFAKKLGDRLVWIDHHDTSIKLDTDFPDVFFDINGFRCATWGEYNDNDDETKVAGCELTWKYFFEEEMPKFIELIGEWDTWRWKDMEESKAPLMTLFLKSDDFNPKKALWWWRSNINMALDKPETVEALLEDDWLPTGAMLKRYQEKQDRGLMFAKAFDAEFAGFRAIMVNQGGNSEMFNALYDTDKHDIMVTFQLVKGDYWTISLYTATPDRVHVGELARKLGHEGPRPSGGGHAGAAGFQTEWEYFWSLVKLPE